jgi:serine/threonine protein kinase
MLLAGDADGLVLGEYTLLSLLGAGGMGRVFRALHRRMGRDVAIKVLPERLVVSPRLSNVFSARSASPRASRIPTSSQPTTPDSTAARTTW